MIEESEDQDSSRMQAKMSFVPIDQLASYITNKVRRQRPRHPLKTGSPAPINWCTISRGSSLRPRMCAGYCGCVPYTLVM